jgi:hypothetical protein
MALFIWLIIRLIQLVFLAGTVFFSHKKSANSVFQPAYNSRTAPMFTKYKRMLQCATVLHSDFSGTGNSTWPYYIYMTACSCMRVAHKTDRKRFIDTKVETLERDVKKVL